jgi:hypothetical protein
LEQLEEIAIADRRSINDELICLLEKGILEWRREYTVAALKETSAAISSLQKMIAEYAAKRSISVDQASDEMGVTEIIAEAMPDMEKILNASGDELPKIIAALESKGKLRKAGRTNIYDPSVVEAIRNVPGKGRPKKAAAPTKPAKKTAK